MINLMFITPFLILIFFGKKDLVIKIFQFYFKTLFTQTIDIRTRTSNVWFYIFMLMNFFMLIKASDGIEIFLSSSSASSPLIIFKFIMLCFGLLSFFSIMVRRLHDISVPGWLLVIGIVFLPLFLILTLMFILPGTNSSNKYGADLRRLPYWYLR